MGSEEDDRLLTSTEVRTWLGVSASTLRRWREDGIGPAYIRPSPRVIRYRRSAVEKWLREQEAKT